jgi:hypothetical protein
VRLKNGSFPCPMTDWNANSPNGGASMQWSLRLSSDPKSAHPTFRGHFRCSQRHTENPSTCPAVARFTRARFGSSVMSGKTDMRNTSEALATIHSSTANTRRKTPGNYPMTFDPAENNGRCVASGRRQAILGRSGASHANRGCATAEPQEMATSCAGVETKVD